MSNEIVINELDEFIKEARNAGIDRIAFSEVNEKRAKQVNPEELHVVHVLKVDLIAYKSSIIYKCTLEDVDLEEIYNNLSREGFEVTRISKNIT